MSARSRTTFLAGVATAPAARAAYPAAVRALLRRNVAALMAGDPAPLVRMYAADAELVFPGDSSWSQTYRGREAIAGFLRRFLAAGVRGGGGRVFVDGPPGAARLGGEFDDWGGDPRTGARVSRKPPRP